MEWVWAPLAMLVIGFVLLVWNLFGELKQANKRIEQLEDDVDRLQSLTDGVDFNLLRVKPWEKP